MDSRAHRRETELADGDLTKDRTNRDLQQFSRHDGSCPDSIGFSCGVHTLYKGKSCVIRALSRSARMHLSLHCYWQPAAVEIKKRPALVQMAAPKAEP